ncbi:TPA: NAD(P)-dependent oxidoreductase [Candidatus Poribacteria bacterium]|nr:NAD-dependent dehydratase [Candidatus Poribacteria bacterium]MEE3194890.1 NAD(P)-dependent oxidoreductase [Candidatus Poribacteria bacterium]HCK15930.1 NAD(P)-dependent oxidoreductase [Candidatus Poribacteria bacterium]|tara:strand:+ start:839 stop:1687 length:849 start_codon:yes stop_codon:yes gene_type:complete
MAKRKVLITGGTGYIAGRMLSELRQRYDLTILDIKDTNREGEKVEDVIITDLLDKDRDNYRQYFQGVDSVIHCGFIGSASQAHRQFWKELDNVAMCYNIYQTCVEEGVRRAVVCSSNHAADFYERLIWQDKMEFVTPDMIPLSDNYYGWAKISYESLGFVFATGAMTDGIRLENVQLRIGGPRETDIEGLGASDLKRVHRALGAYLSLRDQVQLIVKSIEAEDIADEKGVPFQIFYGISDNTHRFWSIQNARDVIGYAPEDDSQTRFANQISGVLAAAKNES